MKILVISPCSSTQKDRRAPAIELYEGREHQKIRAGLRKIRKDSQYRGATVDLCIISTKHGLIKEDYVIDPYDVPNNSSPVLNGEGRSKLHQDVETLIKDYDLVFFLLGATYVKALQLPFNVPDAVTQVFLIFTRTKGYRNLIPERLQNCAAVELHACEFKNGYTAKGLVFNRLCEAACRDGFHVFEKVKSDPQQLLEIIGR